MLLDRLTERAELGQLLEAARGGRSGALVVHGEAGVGKTALLEDAIESAAVQRSAISPEDQHFTLRWVRRTISIIDSHGFVLSSGLRCVVCCGRGTGPR